MVFVRLTFGLPHRHLSSMDASILLLSVQVRLSFALPHHRLSIAHASMALRSPQVRFTFLFSSKLVQTYIFFSNFTPVS
jgi:hypothetical protein